MEIQPLISVIVPVYNVAPYLREALNSVVNQTYHNLEILIIDDGSTDESGTICNKYQCDPRVKVIHQENHGLSAARNAGLDIMTGEYVAFLDSDDAYHTDYVRKMFDCISREKTDIVICRYLACRTVNKMNHDLKSRTNPKAKQGRYNSVEAIQAVFNGYINASVWNKLYRRKIWETNRFPVGRNYEDIETTYKNFDACESVYMLDEALYFYRKHPESITNTHTIENIQDRNIAYAQEEAFIASHIPDVFTEEQLKKRRQSHLNSLMKSFIRAEDKSASALTREMVISLGKEIGLQNMSFKTGAAYQMICSAPWLINAAYSICRNKN